MASDEENKKRIKQILDELGIELKIGGCGCCGSPWVTFKYKGEAIVEDEDYFPFDNTVGK